MADIFGFEKRTLGRAPLSIQDSCDEVAIGSGLEANASVEGDCPLMSASDSLLDSMPESGNDLDGSSHGVIKRIPVEIKPRGKLGILSQGSRKDKKIGGSLRSALSVDLENPEVEKIRKEFEMYRLNKENDITDMKKKETRLQMENKRLRAELLVLQKTCTNLRAERDKAIEAEHQSQARAAAFQSDRDKVQRNFKIFRENMELQLQTMLRDKRNLEGKLHKIAHGYTLEETDISSRPDFDSSLGSPNPGDWWTALESEPSISNVSQVQQSTFRGPELAHSMMEPDGPFNNINREDWSTVLANMTQVLPPVPEHSLSSVLRIYISSPRDTHVEVDILNKEYFPRLSSLCQSAGRTLLLIHLTVDDNTTLTPQVLDRHQLTRRCQINKSAIFLAFLADSTDRFTSLEYKYGYLDNPVSRSSIFCFRETKSGRSSNNEARELKLKVREKGGAKIIDGYTSPNRGVEQVVMEVEKMIKNELGVDHKSDCEEGEEEGGGETDGQEQICGGAVWDPLGDYEQMEAFNYTIKSSCELGFERHYERLNGHVSSAGLLPPLLILGPSGSGKSLLLSKWIQLQQEKMPPTLVLYHFVGQESSISADPIVMIRRLTAQLMQQVNSPPALTADPVRLVEEFPRWLEKVSEKMGGVILVLDAIDNFSQAEVHLKWLLDPLPVDVRMIVSCNDKTCPQAWRSWPTVRVEPLSNKNVKELIHAELATLDADIGSEDGLILTHCRTPATCSPLYVMVLTRHIAGYIRHEGKIGSYLDVLLTCTDCDSLYAKVLDLSRVALETHESRGFLKSILRYIYVSRSGLSELELIDIIPNLTWNFLSIFTEVLSDHMILKYQGGLLMFAHDQVKTAVQDYCFGKDETRLVSQLRQDLIKYFCHSLSPGTVTCRVADELPWLLKQEGDKESLESCIVNLCIFQRLYARGRCAELISYWQFIAADKNSMAQAYFNATRKMEELVGQYNGLITLPRIADMYESLGRFLKDLGLLNQAVPSLQRALEIREISLDPDHPVVARHELAEPLKKRAMSIRKKVKTPRVTSGQIKSVVQRRALQLEELAIGPDSPDLARSLNELGVLHYLQNDFEAAESLFKRALEMRESTLSADHLDVAQSLNNLAALYNDRRQYDKAEPLYDRALQIRVKHHSVNHDSVASVIKHLALLYRKQGKFDKAEPMYKKAIEIREKSFGPEHPSVATALVNLAVLYSQQNKYTEADPLYKRALKIYEDSLGPHHPRVAETLRNLAVMKYEMKDFETAAKFYKRATEIKDSENNYGAKIISRRCSSSDTNSTVKNIMQF
ncbi:hypothetical protein FSP39_021957 [Pinctada imbricata]|uniref:Nephrocystin-3 n=1 Tax=Pinctada imbricata TaxID=66713 RepID=A0AA88XED3_PINIB|nr:hypothetical protein FSP39_021957 [Pinctada imbricata]